MKTKGKKGVTQIKPKTTFSCMGMNWIVTSCDANKNGLYSPAELTIKAVELTNPNVRKI